MMELYRMPAYELARLLRDKELGAAELTQSCLEHIGATEDKVGAFITRCSESALDKAREIDNRRAAGEELPPLAGVPLAVKDNICAKGVLMTCASKMLENFVSPYSATALLQAEQAGMIVIGKTNLDEFAMGATGETSALRQTHNPHNAHCVAGGSSCGSAAALASGQVPLALGTDTGGSIRIPAAFCGVVGLRPTYGSVSRLGVTTVASSMDQIGPMARTVRDTALLYDVLCGWDAGDSISIKRDYPPTEPTLTGQVKGMRIGIPREFLNDDASDTILSAVMNAAKQFEEMGATVFEVSLPSYDMSLPVYYTICAAEAASNLARFDGVRFGYRAEDYRDLGELYRKSRWQGFGMEAKRRIMVGTYVVSAGHYDEYYKPALAAAARIREQYNEALSRCDVLLTPTTPITAPSVGQLSQGPVSLSKTNLFTTGASLAGLPALSVPCGIDETRMPMGLQLIGPRFGEAKILGAGYAFEQAHNPAGMVAAVREDV